MHQVTNKSMKWLYNINSNAEFCTHFQIKSHPKGTRGVAKWKQRNHSKTFSLRLAAPPDQVCRALVRNGSRRRPDAGEWLEVEWGRAGRGPGLLRPRAPRTRATQCSTAAVRTHRPTRPSGARAPPRVSQARGQRGPRRPAYCTHAANLLYYSKIEPNNSLVTLTLQFSSVGSRV